MQRNQRASVSTWFALSAILFFFPHPAAAQMTVTGEGVALERAAPFIGDILYLTLRFRVEGIGAAIPIAFSVVESSRSPDPDRPTCSSRHYDIRPTNYHTARMEYRIPRTAPPEICFNVYAHFTGTSLRSAPIVQNACWGATVRSGTGQRIELHPDLSVSIDSLSVDRTIDINPLEGVAYPCSVSYTIRNTGTSPTERTGRCCDVSFYLPQAEGTWSAGWNRSRTAPVCEVIPGGSFQSFNQVFNIPATATRIKFEADPAHMWTEYNEDNNIAERNIGLPRLRMEPVKPDIRRVPVPGPEKGLPAH
jgi:hypothetical protein